MTKLPKHYGTPLSFGANEQSQTASDSIWKSISQPGNGNLGFLEMVDGKRPSRMRQKRN
jgi:hypothetical protein